MRCKGLDIFLAVCSRRPFGVSPDVWRLETNIPEKASIGGEGLECDYLCTVHQARGADMSVSHERRAASIMPFVIFTRK